MLPSSADVQAVSAQGKGGDTLLLRLYPVYVIGGGAAGLKAAEHLLGKGYEVVLCEATGRLGGRARTEDAVNGTFKVDLGCQWLHSNEWRKEFEDKGIKNKGFLGDDQRPEYPQLDFWEWPDDVRDVLAEASEAIDRAKKQIDQAEASTHLLKEASTWGTFCTTVYDRRFKKCAQKSLDQIVKESHAKNSQAAEKKVQDSPLVEEKAKELARQKYVQDNSEKFVEQAKAELAVDLASPDVKAQVKNVKMNKKKKELATAHFNLGGSTIAALVEKEKDTARTDLKASELKQIEKEQRENAAEGLKAEFNEKYKKKFDEVCRIAFEIMKAQEGPLEEAAEWGQFCNIDRDEERDENNQWPLDGYGGLIASYGANLGKTTKLRIRLKTAVTNIAYTDKGELELSIQENGKSIEKVTARAVVVTVSTGVINAKKLVFDGPDADEVIEAYKYLPMGNYKKVVLVLDKEVVLVKVPKEKEEEKKEEEEEEEEEEKEKEEEEKLYGTSVYWYLDEKNQLWKFLVPDVNRKIVITIVGGQLADDLDESEHPYEKTLLALKAATGITDLPKAADDIREKFISTWGQEKEFLGAYSYTAVGGGGKRKFLIGQPLIKYGIALAGEALHIPYGTAHGAYITGRRAAAKVHEHLKPAKKVESAAE